MPSKKKRLSRLKEKRNSRRTSRPAAPNNSHPLPGKSLARIVALPDRLAPTSLTQAMELAKFLAGSDMVPKDYRDKPGNIVIAISLGHEIGLKWAQSLQNIAVIGGRPTLWGDAGLGIVMSHPDYEWHREADDPQTEMATC